MAPTTSDTYGERTQLPLEADVSSDKEMFLNMMEVFLSFVPGIALKAAMNLSVPDILLASSPRPMTAEEILSEIPGCKDKQDKIAAKNLRSILSVLVQCKVFSESVEGDTKSGKSTSRFGLTTISKWLMKDPDTNCNRMATFEPREDQQRAGLYLHELVLDSDACPYTVANGHTVWEAMEKNQEYATMFQTTMRTITQIETEEFLQNSDFDGIQTLADVGGGNGGSFITAVVKANPHIRGINFDLPHVIAGSPVIEIPGVQHVGGDFFESVPKADAILLKHILHDWDDEHCIKILQNCKAALPETGKVIIFDLVLAPSSDTSLRSRVGHKQNLALLSMLNGKERNAEEWADILSAAGFPQFRIIELPTSHLDIIEAWMPGYRA